jgi:ribosomal protein S27AE
MTWQDMTPNEDDPDRSADEIRDIAQMMVADGTHVSCTGCGVLVASHMVPDSDDWTCGDCQPTKQGVL